MVHVVDMYTSLVPSPLYAPKKKWSGAPSPKTWTIPQMRNSQSNYRMITSSHWNEIVKYCTHMPVSCICRLQGWPSEWESLIYMVCHVTFASTWGKYLYLVYQTIFLMCV